MKDRNDSSGIDPIKRQVCDNFEDSLRRLAVNLLRVVAGGGKPYRLLEDIYRCCHATQSYRERHNDYPTSSRIAVLLDCTWNLEGLSTFASEERREPHAADYGVAYAAAEIRRASLRVVAAQWDNNLTVLRNAERMFRDALLQHVEAKERRRASSLANRSGKSPFSL